MEEKLDLILKKLEKLEETVAALYSMFDQDEEGEIEKLPTEKDKYAPNTPYMYNFVYIFKDPQKYVYAVPFGKVADFCKNHGLSQPAASRALKKSKETKKTYRVQGWQVLYFEGEPEGLEQLLKNTPYLDEENLLQI